MARRQGLRDLGRIDVGRLGEHAIVIQHQDLIDHLGDLPGAHAKLASHSLGCFYNRGGMIHQYLAAARVMHNAGRPENRFTHRVRGYYAKQDEVAGIGDRGR